MKPDQAIEVEGEGGEGPTKKAKTNDDSSAIVPNNAAKEHLSEQADDKPQYIKVSLYGAFMLICLEGAFQLVKGGHNYFAVLSKKIPELTCSGIRLALTGSLNATNLDKTEIVIKDIKAFRNVMVPAFTEYAKSWLTLNRFTIVGVQEITDGDTSGGGDAVNAEADATADNPNVYDPSVVSVPVLHYEKFYDFCKWVSDNGANDFTQHPAFLYRTGCCDALMILMIR